MRPFAILMMFLAWLIYGAMPALGACPMCDRAMPSSPEMHMMAATPMVTAGSHHQKENPCTDSTMHVAFCAFCLVIPPVLAIDGINAVVTAYPAPALILPLQDERPAPASPPPRIA